MGWARAYGAFPEWTYTKGPLTGLQTVTNKTQHRRNQKGTREVYPEEKIERQLIPALGGQETEVAAALDCRSGNGGTEVPTLSRKNFLTKMRGKKMNRGEACPTPISGHGSTQG